jgi:hypothetical protein
MLKKFVFTPGINKEGTRYSAEGTWYDGSNVRFRKGFPEKIGGWQKLSTNTYLGACRKLHNWSSYNGDDYMGMGTSSKAYIELGGRYYDVTPFRYKTTDRIGDGINADDQVNIQVPIGEGAALIGNLIRIENEYMLVESNSAGTPPAVVDVITVARGQAGTVSAASHPESAAYFEFSVANSNPIGISNDTSTVLFRHTDHGAATGDRFTFVSIGTDFTANGITRADLLSAYSLDTSTQGFKITRVLSGDYFEFDVPGATGTNENTTLSAGIGGDSVGLTLAGGTFANTDYIKIENEYIQLGGKVGATNEFNACSRGQLGSLAASHSSAAVSKVTFVGGAADPASISMSDRVFPIYDIRAESSSVSVGSGFGAGRWSGYSEREVTQTTIATILLVGATTIVLGSSTGFSSTGGLALVGSELVSYTGVSPPNLTTVTRGYNSTVAAEHSVGETVYDVDTDWGSWGLGSNAANDLVGIRLWSIDSYKNSLIYAARDGGAYIWIRDEKTSGSIPITTADGVAGTNNGISNAQVFPLSSMGVPADAADTPIDGHGNVPSQVYQIMVYPDYETVIAFGCSEAYDTSGDFGGLFNPMLVRWSSNSAPGSWVAGGTSSAGGQQLTTGSRIVGAMRARREIIVWTDLATYLMKLSLGSGESVADFLFTEIATGVSIIGPNACVASSGSIFWMGERNFYSYTPGGLQIIPCTLLDFVYDDLRYIYRFKITASSNSEFNEVVWFYPSSDSNENDRYVSYNYEDGSWSKGSLPRTAWSDSGLRDKPVSSYIIDSDSSRNYIQEIGSSGDGESVDAHIQTGLFDIADGDSVAYVSKLVPDIEWLSGGDSNSPLDVDIYSRRYTQGNDDSPSQSVSVTSNSLDPSIRVRGRQMSIKFSSDTVNSRWRIGNTLMDIKPDGRR